MNMTSVRLLLTIASSAIIIAGCGGGNGGTVDPAVPAATQAPAASQLVGTAASGAALANAPVAITDSTGASPCEESVITTSALGSYTCTLKAGRTAPFFVVVTDPTGNTPPLVSVSTVTPAAGGALTINATPLTTAILAQLASDGNPLSLVSSKAVDSTALQAVTANVVAQLANVLASVGAPAGYDPFTTSITAATADGTGNTADMVLDVIKVTTDPASGQLALSTVDNPTPILLASATGAGTAVPALDPAVSSLSQAAQLAAKKFNQCFALPTAERVLAKDTTITAANGGPEVTSVGPACDDFVSDATNAGGIDYLHNGFSAGQQFFNILTSDSMTGAKFSVPEIMAFYPADSAAAASSPAGHDRSVLNIKFIDANGNPGNVITVAARIPNTSSTERPTDWWLVGNQQAVDIVIQPTVRRTEQMNPSSTNLGLASTFQSGVLIQVDPLGPGSLSGTGGLTLARVTGPGLPAAGIVYKKSSNANLRTMDLYNKSGNLTAGTQCLGAAPSNCPNLWFSLTQGVTGTAATTLIANPTSGIWAQSGEGIDGTKFVKGAKYQFELFYGTNTTIADRVITKTLLTDVVRAEQAVNLPWNPLGAQSLAALDPNGSLAGAQSALPLDWIQNLSAQQIGSARPFIGGTFTAPKSVPRGATSVVLDNQTVPAFSATTTRGFLFGYRMIDSSNKTAFYRYN
jgi:hypothetical protein